MTTSRPSHSFWTSNGLSLVLAGMFVVCFVSQLLTGYITWNDELARQGELPLDLSQYVSTGHFLSATMENWESEFLQLGMYVLLTVWLRQRGSAESRPLPGEPESERIEKGTKPWPLSAGRLARTLYAHSLSIALLGLFVLSFWLHAVGSVAHENDERRFEELPPVSLYEHIGSAQFWFESMQNWQSEFLAVLVLVLLSIVLREDKSTESKPLQAPHSQTGD